jgi:hypothetical protein
MGSQDFHQFCRIPEVEPAAIGFNIDRTVAEIPQGFQRSLGFCILISGGFHGWSCGSVDHDP